MTTQSLSSDVALRQLPARGERMNHNYALGYHEAWECALHRWRESQLSSGKNPTLKEETVWLEDWLTRNRKIAAETKLCPVCSVKALTLLLALTLRVGPLKNLD